MQYAFILKCKYPNNKISHLVWQRSGSSRKDAEKELRKDFDKSNVFAPGMNVDAKNRAELLDMMEAGECGEEIDETQKLFETAAKKAAKLDNKTNGTTADEQGQVQTTSG